MDQTARSGGGLGLLVIRCFKGSNGTPPATVSVVTDCSSPPGSGQALYVQPVYPAPSTNPCGTMTTTQALDSTGTLRNTFKMALNTPLSASNFKTSATLVDSIIILDNGSTTTNCTGGNLVTGGYQPVGGPSAVAGVTNTGTAQAQGLLPGDSDYLAAVVYLPTSAPTSMQELTSAATFEFRAEQSTAP